MKTQRFWKTHVCTVALFVILVCLVSGQGRRFSFGLSQETAVYGAGNVSIYLPTILQNYDAQLGTPLFGVQMYGNTSSSSAFHPSLLATKASWLRTPIYWSTVEPTNETPAVYEWTAADNKLAASRSDMGQLNMIATVENAPAWAAPAPDGPLYPQYVDDFAEFMGDVVERYDGDGIDDAPGSPVIIYWEIYNEPDHNSDPVNNPYYVEPMRWGDHAQEYVAMLAAVYPAIKAANPKAQVVLGGIARDWFEEDGGPFVKDFLENVLLAGGGNYFDVMNFHFYPLFYANWTTNQGPGLREKTAEVRSVLHSHGLNKPIIVTEAGWHSNDAPGPTIPGSPEIQSRYVIELFAHSYAAHLDVMIWWLLVDSDFPYPFMNGLVTNTEPPTEKLSFYVYQNLVDRLSTTHYVRALTTAETSVAEMEVYKFDDNTNAHLIYVAWLNPVDTDEVRPLRLVAPQAVVQDGVTGTEMIVYDGDDGVIDGRILIIVGANPLYIEIDK